MACRRLTGHADTSIVMLKQLSQTRYLLLALFSLAFLLQAGCSKGIMKSLSDLAKLRNDLMNEYKVQGDVNVTVQNSTVLGISFINSAFNKLSESERETKAREIAYFAKNHYASINFIDRIWVSFVVYKNYIIFQHTNNLNTYFFDKRELIAADYIRERRAKGFVATSYEPTSNTTSVYLNENLQLYSEGRGDRTGGIMLFPHFAVTGDNVSAPRVIVPKAVSLDFSTYGPKRMFPDNPPLVIYVDNQKIFSGIARTNKVLGDDTEKSVNEFLSADLPYEKFLQVSDGKRVKFVLGTKELQLTPKHLEAFRALRRCVEELKCT